MRVAFFSFQGRKLLLSGVLLILCPLSFALKETSEQVSKTSKAKIWEIQVERAFDYLEDCRDEDPDSLEEIFLRQKQSMHRAVAIRECSRNLVKGVVLGGGIHYLCRKLDDWAKAPYKQALEEYEEKLKRTNLDDYDRMILGKKQQQAESLMEVDYYSGFRNIAGLTWLSMALSPKSAVADWSVVSIGKNMLENLGYAIGMLDIDDPYTEIELLFVRKFFIIKDNNPALFEQIKQTIYNMRDAKREDLDSYREWMEIATSIPLGTSELAFNESVVESTFSYFDETIREDLINLISDMVYESANPQYTRTRFPSYFQGYPGVGKTYAAQSVSQLLGVPVTHLTLEGASIEDIVGTGFTHDGKDRPGRLIEGLITAAKEGDGSASMVLFIDEFDRLLSADDPGSRAVLSLMLKMLDPDRHSFFSPYLKAEIKLPRLVILAGNKGVDDEALSDRFNLINFEGYTLPQKLEMTDKILLPKLLNQAGMGLSDLTPEDQRKIDDLVRSNPEKSGLRYIQAGIDKMLSRKVRGWNGHRKKR